MYPEWLEADVNQNYFQENEYFIGKFNFIHTYLHQNYQYRMHAHQFYEINIIVSGEGMHYIENNRLDAKAGDVFVIPPEVRHGYYSNGTLDIFHVLIKKDFLARYSEELGEVGGFGILFDIEPDIRKSTGASFNLNLGHGELEMFKGVLEQMVRVEKRREYVRLNALTMDFICRLCNRISSVTMSERDREIVGIMEYIRSNIDEKITLSSLCEQSHMSAATLNRRFRSAVGQSPMEYVLSVRVARAKELISEGKLSRTEIALSCGFYDLAHMNKYL